MEFGSVVHISSLKVGDIIRPTKGPLLRVLGAEPLFVPEDSDKPESDRRRIEATRGWRGQPASSEHDCRWGYDTMTVCGVDHDFVRCIRPYFHVNADGTLGAVGFESVCDLSREHGGLWYELLNA